MPRTTAAKPSPHDTITTRLVAAIEAGTPPWRKPWRGTGGAFPLRHSGERYRGINTLMLWCAAEDQGYANPHWMTYRQAQELGGQVRRGERGTGIIKYGTFEQEDDAGEARKRGYIRGYTVFNADQIDGLPEAFTPTDAVDTGARPIEAYEDFFERTGMDITIGGIRACYYPAEDRVQMPPVDSFDTALDFYRVLLHEGAHWTGHGSRLDRRSEERTRDAYAHEELVAEIAACLAGAELGIEPAWDRSAAYLENWVAAMRKDNREIFRAATAAQAAADFLLDAGGGHDRQKALAA